MPPQSRKRGNVSIRAQLEMSEELRAATREKELNFVVVGSQILTPNPEIPAGREEIEACFMLSKLLFLRLYLQPPPQTDLPANIPSLLESPRTDRTKPSKTKTLWCELVEHARCANY